MERSHGARRMLAAKTTKYATLLLYMTLLQLCAAYDMTHTDVSNPSYYKELTRRNILVVDELHTHVLERRDDPSNSTDSTSSSATSSSADFSLPMPFDTSLGNNFTDTNCPNFFSQFLSDSTFLSCLPISLLLQNSMSFFQAMRSSSKLERTLDTSCSASLAVCSPLMDNFADQLIAQGNCQDDYNRQNPLVMQAYSGLKAYEPLYQATCLKDSSTSRYTFLEAMDSDNADDSYPYSTAVGLSLPAASKPNCSTGLKATMEIFAGYAAQKDQPLSSTYLDCATQVNTECGPGFASTQVKSVSKVTASSDAKHVGSNILLIASLACMVISMFT